MRILLVQPNVTSNMVGFTSLVRTEPLALEILAGGVPQHEVKILDLRVDPSPLSQVLADFRPELVGLTGYTTDVHRMWEIVTEVKAHDPGIVMVVGGYHASLVPEDFDLPAVDVIVVGEGEETFAELVDCLGQRDDLAKVRGIVYRRQGRAVATALRPLARNLNELPLAARHLTEQYRPHYHFHFWDNPYTVETARGCPFRCTFCAVWKFHRKMCRFRDPELVLEELQRIPSDVVCFVDDNFFQNFGRAERLYGLIKAAGLKSRYWIQARSDSIARRPDLIKKWAQIGLHTILVGFEKFRQEELADINKRNTIEANEKAMEILNAYGIDMWGAFIVDPGWVESDFDDLIDYVRSKSIHFPQFTILTPLPGTAFFQESRDKLITRNYEVFDFLHTVLPTRLPLEEFYQQMAKLYARTTLGLGELRARLRAGQIPRSALERVRDLLKDVTDPQAYLRSGGPHEMAMAPKWSPGG